METNKHPARARCDLGGWSGADRDMFRTRERAIAPAPAMVQVRNSPKRQRRAGAVDMSACEALIQP